MIILAIDTATKLCAACLFDSETGKPLAKQSDDIGRGHAEHLLALIDRVMLNAGVSIEAIDKIAVSIGPGSFTGIRVGVAAARGFGLSLDKPVVGVSTLQAIAAGYQSPSPFAVTISAGRNQAYAQGFNADSSALDDAFIVKLDEAPELQIDGRYLRIIGDAASHVDPARADIAQASATGDIVTFARLGATSSTAPAPLYLRAADAKTAEGFALPRKSESAQ